MYSLPKLIVLLFDCSETKICICKFPVGPLLLEKKPSWESFLTLGKKKLYPTNLHIFPYDLTSQCVVPL